MTRDRAAILCVDDEPNVLEGLSLHLGRDYRVTSAPGGAEGLEQLAAREFSVIISDMRMPGMDGTAFLEQARVAAPNAVRMLLSGYADQAAVLQAINDGLVFRYLRKPCSPEQLVASVADAVTQHYLALTEQVVVRQTLLKLVATLMELLAVANPLAFGRCERMRKRAAATAESLGLEDVHYLEMATLLSQAAAVTLPEATATRVYSGSELNSTDASLVRRLPAVTKGLLANVPRMGRVTELLVASTRKRRSRRGGVAAEVLCAVMELEQLQSHGAGLTEAMATLESQGERHSVTVLAALRASCEQECLVTGEAVQLSVEELRVGMVLAAELRAEGGSLLAAQGQRVSDSLLARLAGLAQDASVGPVTICVQSVPSGPEHDR